VWLDFNKDALIDRWRLYKIAHKQEDNMGYPKRVGGVHFIEVFGRSEPVLPALLLRPCPYQKPHPGLKRDEQHVGHLETHAHPA
jgi:hypothetical protein